FDALTVAIDELPTEPAREEEDESPCQARHERERRAVADVADPERSAVEPERDRDAEHMEGGGPLHGRILGEREEVEKAGGHAGRRRAETEDQEEVYGLRGDVEPEDGEH